MTPKGSGTNKRDQPKNDGLVQRSWDDGPDEEAPRLEPRRSVTFPAKAKTPSSKPRRASTTSTGSSKLPPNKSRRASTSTTSTMSSSKSQQTLLWFGPDPPASSELFVVNRGELPTCVKASTLTKKSVKKVNPLVKVDHSHHTASTDASTNDNRDPTSDGSKTSQKWRCFGGVLCLVLTLILIAILAGVLASRSSKSASLAHLVDAPFLPDFTKQAIAQDASCPQARALEWLVEHYHDQDAMPDWRKRQLIALLTLQYSFDVDYLVPDPKELVLYDEQPFGAVVPKNECDDPSAKCTPGGEFQELKLLSSDLKGTIPPEVSFLTALTSLSLRDGELTGPLPSELGELTALTSMYLHSNQLTGSIPQQVGALSSLVFLSLYDNQLSSSLPRELGQLTDLVSLSLGGNQITGPLPEELGTLTELTFLSLYDNQLTGSIPPRLVQATNLEHLIVNGNELTGSLASGICAIPQLNNIVVDCRLVACDCPSCGCY